MKCWIGLGSNLGERGANLENAAKALMRETKTKPLASPLVETPAMVPSDAPLAWRKPFLNGVLELEWRESPAELLRCLKRIETELGREPTERWAPRGIDLDLLTFGDQAIHQHDLQVPHPEAWNRQFVLAPLKHLCPSMQISNHKVSVLERSRALRGPLPLWMGILNLTPDSFSDGRALDSIEALETQVDRFARENTQILDLGAESTRPGARALSAAEEWARLLPALEVVVTKFKGRIFRPSISVDTYHPETAAKAIAYGVDIINDVSGMKDLAMLELMQSSDCQFVLMHSLSVPADPKVILRSERPMQDIKEWAHRKMEQLDRSGIKLDRVLLDPGVGFGKTSGQSLALLQQIDQLLDFPLRILVGHSRKSALDRWGTREVFDRDWETLGVSLKLAEKGVDILRVHTPDRHQRAFRAFREVE